MTAPQQQPFAYHPQGAPHSAGRPGNGLGVAGFVCGLVGLVFCWLPPLAIVLGVLGVVLGGCGISAARNNGSGNGLAVAGLVCGIVATVIAIAILAAVT